jgi:hypothetical protein
MEARISLNFRPVGGFGWKTGRTENISKTGLLFKAQEAIAVGTRVEMRFLPPSNVWGASSNLVWCRGKVVRITPSAGQAGRVSLAVKILDFSPDYKPADW